MELFVCVAKNILVPNVLPRKNVVYVKTNDRIMRIMSEFGQRTPIDYLAAQDCGRLDLVVILDNSGSVEEVFERQKSLALDLIGGVPIQVGGSQVGIVSFAQDASVDLDLYPPSDREKVINILSAIEFRGGSTNAVDAFRKARAQFARANAPKKVILIITDGNSQNKWGEILDTCGDIRDSGIEILATTQSTEYSEKELRLYVGDIDKMYLPGRVGELRQYLTKLAGPDCKPDATDAPGTKPPTKPDKKTPSPPIFSGPCKADILFVVDTSGSVVDDFREEVVFTEKILQSLRLGGASAPHYVGIIEYSASTKQSIFVDWGKSQSTNQELIDELQNMEYYGGTTYTAKALQLALQMMQNGRRPDTNLIVILIHDGITYDLPVPVAEQIRQQPRTDFFAVGVNKLVLKETLYEMTGDKDKVFIGDIPTTSAALLSAMAPYTECTGGEPRPPPRTPRPGPGPRTTTPRPRPRPTDKVTKGTAKPAKTPGPGPAPKTEATTAPPPATVPPGPGNCILDVLIVLDTSNSVKGNVFENEKLRAHNIVDKLSIGGPTGARVAFIDFAGPGSARTEFSLDKFDKKADIKAAISSAEFIAGTTAAGDALRLAYKELDPSKGARPGVATQVVIFLSDGLSQQAVEQSAAQLKTRAQRVYAVATDRFYGPDQLKEIASDESLWFHIEDKSEKERYEAALDALTADC